MYTCYFLDNEFPYTVLDKLNQIKLLAIKDFMKKIMPLKT
jgi:hypothetical protein